MLVHDAITSERLHQSGGVPNHNNAKHTPLASVLGNLAFELSALQGILLLKKDLHVIRVLCSGLEKRR